MFWQGVVLSGFRIRGISRMHFDGILGVTIEQHRFVGIFTVH